MRCLWLRAHTAGKRPVGFSRHHEACALEAKKNRENGMAGLKAFFTVYLKEKEPTSELENEFSKIAVQHKLSPEIVGQAVVGRVYELSREGPVDEADAF